MKFRDAMTQLRKMGTAQNVKVYQRHGAGDKLFGVSFANFDKLKKQIKTDHTLAEQLWKTGNSDARTLAIMIADPDEFSASSADAWLTEISYDLLADLFAGLIARSPPANRKWKKWSRSRKEYARQCGYGVVCSMLKNDSNSLSDEECKAILETIESEIRTSPNRARHAMYMTVIAIGVYKSLLRKSAIQTARMMGKVDVDHGETSCKTPDAEAYIVKAAKRNEAPRKTAS